MDTANSTDHSNTHSSSSSSSSSSTDGGSSLSITSSYPPFSSSSSSSSSSFSSSLLVDLAPSVDVSSDIHRHYYQSYNTPYSYYPYSSYPLVPSSSSSSSSDPHDKSNWNVSGEASRYSMDSNIFHSNYHSFAKGDIALAPGNESIIQRSYQSETAAKNIVKKDQIKAIKRRFPAVNPSSSSSSSSSSNGDTDEKESSSNLASDSIDDYERQVAENIFSNNFGPWADKYEIITKGTDVSTTEQQKANLEEWEKQKQLKKQRIEAEETKVPRWEDVEQCIPGIDVLKESSTLHIPSLYDYQGRSYLVPPSAYSNTPLPERNYPPKSLIHTFVGHTKGVNAIQLFPNTGHLLYSGSLDHTIKIWYTGANEGYKCIRTLTGHTEGIRDIHCTIKGEKIYSVSYDKYVKLWDVETGQCIWRATSGRIPYCVRPYPSEEKENEILVGQANNKVVGWDTRLNKIIQKYEEHLGPVNCVSFIDNAKRFVSTSDDKKMFIWEYGVPVVVKHIADPQMHSMPSVTEHPSGDYFVAQSMDNQILIFDNKKNHRLSRKKRFIGHLCSGYACQVNFSPCGDYLASGDAKGRLFVWDCKKRQVNKILKAHDKVTMGVVWHPKLPSRLFTASWDGTIKIFD